MFNYNNFQFQNSFIYLRTRYLLKLQLHLRYLFIADFQTLAAAESSVNNKTFLPETTSVKRFGD
ncbi:MAG: hypothetical protein WKF91_20750 [Segetibacter sp.]